MKQATTPAALAGVRVVEMGQLIAGPFAGKTLGEFGADVIKIEPPGAGDPLRNWRLIKNGTSVWWQVQSRNKRSVAIDLRQPDGQQLARDLIAEADVLIENFRPGTLEGWGMSPDELHQLNPGLVILRISGYGQTGPYRDLPGFGVIGEAMGGLRHVTGEPDRPPARAGISIGDSLTAMHAVMGITMALHHRANTGRGQMLDVALYESVLAVMENLVTEYDLTGYVRERSGSILPGIAPSNVYPCAQGEMILIGGNGDTVFARLAQTMGMPELAKDPKFVDHASRGVNQAELDEIIAAWTKGFALSDLLALLEADGIPSGRVFRAPDMLENEQYKARETIVETDHPVFGKIKMQGAFPKMSETPGKVRWPGPTLGQHTDEVLTGLAGLDAETVAQLRAKGIV